MRSFAEQEYRREIQHFDMHTYAQHRNWFVRSSTSVRFNSETGRWKVKLCANGELGVKAANLEVRWMCGLAFIAERQISYFMLMCEHVRRQFRTTLSLIMAKSESARYRGRDMACKLQVTK